MLINLQTGKGLRGFKISHSKQASGEPEGLKFFPVVSNMQAWFDEMPTCKTWSRPANFSFLAMELIKELIMASQTRPIPAQKRQRRSSMQYSVPTMTERQLDAYLAARDTIRLIQRTSSLVFPAGTARSNSSRASRD